MSPEIYVVPNPAEEAGQRKFELLLQIENGHGTPEIFNKFLKAVLDLYDTERENDPAWKRYKLAKKCLNEGDSSRKEFCVSQAEELEKAADEIERGDKKWLVDYIELYRQSAKHWRALAEQFNTFPQT